MLQNAASPPKGYKLSTCDSQTGTEIVRFISQFDFFCLCDLANKTIAVVGAQLEILQFSDVPVVVSLNCKPFMFNPFSDTHTVNWVFAWVNNIQTYTCAVWNLNIHCGVYFLAKIMKLVKMIHLQSYNAEFSCCPVTILFQSNITLDFLTSWETESYISCCTGSTPRLGVFFVDPGFLSLLHCGVLQTLFFR